MATLLGVGIQATDAKLILEYPNAELYIEAAAKVERIKRLEDAQWLTRVVRVASQGRPEAVDRWTAYLERAIEKERTQETQQETIFDRLKGNKEPTLFDRLKRKGRRKP